MPKHQKRRHRDSASDEENIRRKIKKLQGRLDKKVKRNHSPSFSGDRTEPTSPITASLDKWLSTFSDGSFEMDDPVDATREAVNLEVENKDSTSEPELDDDILAILGEKVASSKVLLAPPFQKDVASTWTVLLKNGLCEEERNDLIKKYPPAENCQLLEAPKLNPEVSPVISNSCIRRDNRFVLMQNQMGAAISALGQLLTACLSEEKGGNITYIKLISDASRLFLDLHQKHTLTRRELVSINLDIDIKDFITNVPIDGWLFGDKLGDRLSASNDLANTTLELKPRQKVSKTQGSLNYRRPSYENQQASYGQQAYRSGRANRGGRAYRGGRANRGGRDYGGQASYSGHASYDGYVNYGERQRYDREGYNQRRNDYRERNFRQEWEEPNEESRSPSRSWNHYRSRDRSPSFDGRSSPWSQASYHTRRSP